MRMPGRIGHRLSLLPVHRVDATVARLHGLPAMAATAVARPLPVQLLRVIAGVTAAIAGAAITAPQIARAADET